MNSLTSGLSQLWLIIVLPATFAQAIAFALAEYSRNSLGRTGPDAYHISIGCARSSNTIAQADALVASPAAVSSPAVSAFLARSGTNRGHGRCYRRSRSRSFSFVRTLVLFTRSYALHFRITSHATTATTTTTTNPTSLKKDLTLHRLRDPRLGLFPIQLRSLLGRNALRPLEESAPFRALRFRQRRRRSSLFMRLLSFFDDGSSQWFMRFSATSGGVNDFRRLGGHRSGMSGLRSPKSRSGSDFAFCCCHACALLCCCPGGIDL